MDGLVYMLNQAGLALAEANQRIGQLMQENEALRAQLETSGESS
jgi:uncharacterized small protein (DUF1192 family)